MINDFKDYKVNVKHPVIQGIAFIVTLAVAVTAITFGVSNIGRKDPGYYYISPSSDEEAVNYSSGFELVYYFDGTSNEIKENTLLVTEAYSTALARAYKLLDAKNEYTSYNNLAYLSNHQNEWVEISEELYTILKDAYNKTDGESYNMFAGAFYEHWNTIIISEDSMDFDPIINSEEALRLEALADATNEIGNFSLDFSEGNMVKFSVNADYITFLNDNEEATKVLDLNLMHDAYVLSIVVNALEEAGYNQGYIMTDSGITYSLSGYNGGEFAIYGPREKEEDELEVVLTKEATPGSCISVFYTFDRLGDDPEYFTTIKDGLTYYRSPFISPTDFGTKVYEPYYYAISSEGDVINCVYENIKKLS